MEGVSYSTRSQLQKIRGISEAKVEKILEAGKYWRLTELLKAWCLS